MRRNRTPKHKLWWTRERVTEGMLRFYQDFKVTPNSSEAYASYTKNIAFGNKGWNYIYPSYPTVLRYFHSFQHAWTMLGIPMKPAYKVWTPIEDWFLSEATGVLSRNEIATTLNRTPDSVHRRQYDLGLNARTRWGWTAHRVQEVTGIDQRKLYGYIERGELPIFRGNRYIYIDPTDLLVVKEIDWTNPPPELEYEIRKGLIKRLCKILNREDWRKESIYKPVKDVKYDERDRPVFISKR